MVFLFGTVKITPTLEVIRDCIDIVGTGRERRTTKLEDIFIPNKPYIENIADLFEFGKNIAYLCHESHATIRDLYIQFGHASFYATQLRVQDLL